MGRKGFVGDVKLIASATVDDFLEARNIAKPNETIGSAASRPDMPVKVKAAMRSLLLSTANVPATEGRKAALRFNGHGANLCFGPSTFFVTPNFADTYSPLMPLLQEGPAADSHMHINLPHDASRSTAHQITQAEPRMPQLRRMHQLCAAQLRA